MNYCRGLIYGGIEYLVLSVKNDRSVENEGKNRVSGVWI
jgi:hypothetical protein